MSDVEFWLFFGGPEPAHIRPLLDTIRDLPPATPEQRERAARRFFETLDASLAESEEPPAAPLAPLAPLTPTAPTAPLSKGQTAGVDDVLASASRLTFRALACRSADVCPMGHRWAAHLTS